MKTSEEQNNTKKPELTLAHINEKVLPNRGKVSRVSDFVSKEDYQKLQRLNILGGRKKKKQEFDDIDAYEAEIVARFGYDVFQEWESGRIPNKRIQKWILAERARSSAEVLAIEAILANGFAGCANHDINGRPPKTSKNIQKIMKIEVKKVEGIK